MNKITLTSVFLSILILCVNINEAVARQSCTVTASGIDVELLNREYSGSEGHNKIYFANNLGQNQSGSTYEFSLYEVTRSDHEHYLVDFSFPTTTIYEYDTDRGWVHLPEDTVDTDFSIDWSDCVEQPDYTQHQSTIISFDSGTGSESDPYEISTLEQLQGIKDNLDKHFILTADIDASDTENWNNGAGFEPIGDFDNAQFTGSLDGQGHVITGLYINRSTTDYIGLFGRITSGSFIKDVGLKSVNITGKNDVGSLVGYSTATASKISGSYATGSVKGNGNYVGGLVGNNRMDIVESYADVQVNGNNNAYIGGLAGYSGGDISESYAAGSVSGGNYIGGLIGFIGNSILTTSYATGSVSGSANVGGLIGGNDGSVTKSFWDKEATGQNSSPGSDNSFGKTTAEMKTLNTYLAAGWDFDVETENGSNDTWDIDNVNGTYKDGYPFLAWENGSVTALTTNAAPVATAPSLEYINTNAANVPLNDDIQISDTDGDDQTVTFAITGGTLQLGANGINFGGSGNGSAAFTASGSLTDINTALDAATFTHDGNTRGDKSGKIKFVSNDGKTDSDTASVTFDIFAELEAFALADSLVSCYGQQNGGATAAATGGKFPYSYSWSNGANTSSITGIHAGTFTVTITDAYNDTSSAQVEITQPDSLIVNAVIDKNVSTYGGDDGGVSASAQGGTRPYSYSWNTGATTPSIGFINDDNESVPAGIYTVTVTDQKGCIGIASATVTQPAPFAGGDGTEANPYQISTVEQLQYVNDYLDKYFILINDIDASATAQWNPAPVNGYYGFEPLGTEAGTKFTGSLDGDGYVINGLYINRGQLIGLFGSIGAGGSVTNIGMESVNITGTENIGGLAGLNRGSISESYVIGKITGSSNNIGGLVGNNYGGKISLSYAAGEVSAKGYVGGLVGSNGSDGEISESYATGTVTGANYYVGGLVGYNYGTIAGSYAAGRVKGSTSSTVLMGGLVGANSDGTITNSFWDREATWQSISAGSPASLGKTTAEMKNPETYLDAGWDLDVETENGSNDTWDIDNVNGTYKDGYPFLAWENGSATAVHFNAKPSVTGLPAALSFIEESKGQINLSDAVFSDEDGDALTLTLKVTEGTFSSPGDGANTGAGITESLVDDTTITLAGSANDINTYLDTESNLSYTGATDVSGEGADTLYIYADDGTANPLLGKIPLNITEVNDAPSLTVTATDPSYTEGQNGIAVFSGASAASGETGQKFDSLAVEVTGLLADSTEILNIDGSDVALYQGNVISTQNHNLNISVTFSGNTAMLGISGSMSNSDLEALIDGMTYRNKGDNPGSESRKVSLILLKDAGGTSNAGVDTVNLAYTSTISVTPVNDGPALAINKGISVNEGETEVINTSELNEGDPDDSGTGLTYSIVSLPTGGSIQKNEVNLGLNDTFTQDDIDNNRIRYIHEGQTKGSDSFKFILSDGGEDNASALTGQVFNITIVDVTPPVIESIELVGNPQATDTLITYDVTFNEKITGASILDFQVKNIEGSGAGIIYSLSADTGKVIQVTAGIVGLLKSLEGKLRLDFTGSVKDPSGNELNTAYTDGEVFTTGLKYENSGWANMHIRPEDVPSTTPFKLNTGSLGLLFPGLTTEYGSSQPVIMDLQYKGSDHLRGYAYSNDDSIPYWIKLYVLNATTSTYEEALELTGTAGIYLDHSFSGDSLTSSIASIEWKTMEVEHSNVGIIQTDQVLFKLKLTSGGFVTALNTIVKDWSYNTSIPELSNLATNLDYTEGATAILIDDNATISDTQMDALNSGMGEYEGSSLTINRHGGANANDSLSLDFSTAGLTLFGTDIQSGGQTFATFSSSGGKLTINFTSSGLASTTELVNRTIQNIRYQNTSDDPDSTVTLDYIFSDGFASASGNNQVLIDIELINNPPGLTAQGQDPAFKEEEGGVVLFGNTTISTIESVQKIKSMALTIANVSEGANEILNIDGSDVALTDGNSVTTQTNSLSASVSLSDSIALVTLSGGSLSSSDVQTLVNNATYRVEGDDMGAVTRVVTLSSLTDNGGTAHGGDDTANLSVASTVTLTDINDAPTLTASGVDPTFSEYGDPVSVFSGVSVSTVEAGQTITGLQLRVSHVNNLDKERLTIDGTEVLLTAGAKGITAGDSLSYSVGMIGGSTFTAEITFSGLSLSESKLQAILDEMTYKNTAINPFEADRVVTVTQLSDDGGTANGGTDNSAPGTSSTITVIDVILPAPVLASSTPAGGAGGVDREATISATFDKDITAVNLAGVTVTYSGGTLAGVNATVTGSNTVSISHPTLAYNTSYTVTIPAGAVQNVDGVASAAITWSFTTAQGTPEVLSSTPADGAEKVSPEAPVQVTYSLDIAVADSAGITLTGEGGDPVEATLSADGATLSLSAELAHATTYTVSIADSAVESATGNPAGAYSFSFTTIMPVPAITSIHPQDGEEFTAPGVPVQVVFDQPVSLENTSLITMSYLGGEPVTVTPQVSGDTLKLGHPGFTPGATVQVSVGAGALVNADGVSATDTTWSFGVIPQSPESPQLLAPANEAAATDTAVVLTWAEAAHTGSYTLQVAADADFEQLIIAEESLSDTSYALGELAYSTTYWWRVRAAGPAESSPWSPVFSFTTKVELPGQPFLLLPADDSVEVPIIVDLVWNGAARATSYKVQLSTAEDFSELALNKTTSDTTSKAANLIPDQEYWWRVRAENASGAGPWSSPYYFRTIPNEGIRSGRPLGEVILDEDFQGFTAANLDTVFINLGEGPLTYSASVDTALVEASVSEGLLSLAPVANAFGQVRVAVAAFDGGTHRAYDTLAVFINPVNDPPVLTAPTDTTYEVSGGEFVFAYGAWVEDLENPVSELSVEVQTDPEQVTASVDTEQQLVLVNGNGYQGPATATVTITDPDGGSTTVTLSLEFVTITSAEGEQGIPAAFALSQNYPNPFNPATTIGYETPVAGRVRLEVFNVMGQRVASLVDGNRPAGRHTVVFEAGGLSSGVYLVRMVAPGFSASSRMTLLK